MMFYFENYKVFFILFLLIFIFLISQRSKKLESFFSNEVLKKIYIGRVDKKKNIIFLVISFVFLVIALARPVIQNKPIVVKENSFSLIIALDISKTMNSSDLYPSRIVFAKEKIKLFLDNLVNQNVGLVAFSDQVYLISPITNDYKSLKYLLNKLKIPPLIQNKPNFYNLLGKTNELLKGQREKILVIFSDGGDKKNFAKEINFANKKGLKIFIYATATKKGGVIKTKDGDILKDEFGNIVISKLNTNLKALSLNTNGAYLKYSLNNEDIKQFTLFLKNKFLNKDDIIIKNNQELFYYPLIFALLFYILAISGLKKI